MRSFEDKLRIQRIHFDQQLRARQIEHERRQACEELSDWSPSVDPRSQVSLLVR